MYFPRNWEFGSALSKLRNNCGGGLNPPNPPSGYASARRIYVTADFDLSLYENIYPKALTAGKDNKLT
jgi:hypothetical protein